MLSGLLRGACASAGIPAEEHRDRKQEAEDSAGGATEPEPTRKTGARRCHPRTSGATVSGLSEAFWC